jgi:hypothetical protein
MFQRISAIVAVVTATPIGAGSALASTSEAGAAPAAVRMQRVDPHLSSHKASRERISASLSPGLPHVLLKSFFYFCHVC